MIKFTKNGKEELTKAISKYKQDHFAQHSAISEFCLQFKSSLIQNC